MTWRGSTSVQDRIFAALTYLLPLFYVMQFALKLQLPLLRQFPDLNAVLQVLLLPVAFIFTLVPFGLAGIVIFFVLFLLVVRNERIAHFIRFNTMQAILLDILLVLCNLVVDIVLRGLGFNLVTETLLNVIFLGTLAACFYSIVQSILGRYAEIPALSEAVYAQVR
ncbi:MULTISPECIES: Tic20 family protein [unclassified Coleofasciculus]|uniref:Tic20 family protein n=1 Tax=unclassified Coleofasciculus TaxID=2692782 RepID=UPI0018808233|nr:MULTISPECIES: Tic20 family protein [unclassified Coleofasciculus]MBE9125537.1 hypothetical protein [Coleofasciculus sp. LEGE 07081]MBE9147828.1 hypothetical protein [Coleofasciculus sp. LEGE 07092]